MSYSIFIHKFKAGESSPFDYSELETKITKYGRISEEEFGLELLTTTDLFENADLIGEGKSEIIGISIHRPEHCQELKELIFDLLEIQGTCFFDQEMNYLQIRNADLTDFPEDLIENASEGIVKIMSVSEIWPLEQ